MEVQVFGVQRHADVRKALRFFAERRIRTHFVDFTVRGPSEGELRRFAQKFGMAALIDRDSRRFRDLGLASARYGDATWMRLAVDEPLMLTLPLVRCGAQLTIGPAEADWKSWVTSAK